MLGCCFAVGVGPYGGSNIVPSGCVVLRIMYQTLLMATVAVSSPLPYLPLLKLWNLFVFYMQVATEAFSVSNQTVQMFSEGIFAGDQPDPTADR